MEPPKPITAVASALPSVDEDPLILDTNILGAKVYPSPGFVKSNDETVPAVETIAVIDAPTKSFCS